MALDVIIIGGGVAGTTAALGLRQDGLQVALIEAQPLPQWRIGETLAAEARPVLQALGLWEAHLAAGHLPSYGNVSCWGWDAAVDKDFASNLHGHAWQLDRPVFEHTLSHVAQSRGVQRCLGTTVSQIKRHDDQWTVQAGEQCLSDIATVVGADRLGTFDADALAVQVRTVDAYGRLAPDQKSRLIRALQAGGAVTGYLGDGINDAPALKAAHIGLSVAGATGVAQAAADMILLDQDLAVVADGVEEGRRTFANILKYVRMGASSNFGNMLSMAVASLFLPFLPMLPTQILLNNLLYDLSEIGIPFDSVRPEAVARPQVWDMRALVRFAAVMGPLSSLFDLLTFGGLIVLFHASPPEFRTAWFLESMATQILVIFIIRTNGRPWADLPQPVLAVTSLGALVVAMIVPFTPAGPLLGFHVPPLAMTGGILLIVTVYLICAELLKQTAIRIAPPRRRWRTRSSVHRA